jgi:hypothetical protein
MIFIIFLIIIIHFTWNLGANEIQWTNMITIGKKLHVFFPKKNFFIWMNFETIVLAICYYINPSLGLVTEAKACKVTSQERKPGSERKWRNEPSHSQRSFHLGSWSPGGLPNVQRAISGVKTQWIEELFIPLKSYWNLDV